MCANTLLCIITPDGQMVFIIIKNWEVWNEPEKYEGDELRRQIYRLDFFHKFIEFVAENKLHLISLHGTPMKVFLFLLCLQNT